MFGKVTLTIALVIGVALRCTHGQTAPTSIQFQLDAGLTGSEAMAAGTMDIAVGIQILITPTNGFTQAPIVVTISVTGGSAGQDDFNLARSTVTFDQGSNHENTINTFIDVVDDLVVEGIETIVVSGSVASTSGSVPLSFVTGRDTTTITIADNDILQVGFELLTYNVNEGDNQEVCAVLFGTGTLGNAVQVNVFSADVSATAGLDYNAVSQGLIFSSGAAVGNALGRRCFSVQTIEDGINEPSPNPESLGLTLTSTNTLLAIQAGRGTATVNILDDDPPITIGLTLNLGTTNYEIPESTSPFPFCAQIFSGSIAPGTTITVNLVTQPGSAPPAGAQDPDDYVGGSFPLVFTSTTGNTPVCVPAGNIVIVNDDICEDDETFLVQLIAPSGGAILSPSTGIATIIDDDAAIIGTDQSSYSVTECEDPQLIFDLTIISGQKGPGRSCSVRVITLDDSATAPEDYIGITVPVFYDITTTTVSVSIDIVDDLVFEPTEHFNISLSTSSDGCVILPGNEIVQVYIVDDEDCTDTPGMPCSEYAMCEELPKRDNFTCTCTPPSVGDGFMCTHVTVGDDPHFSIALPSGKLLCYTVQGEHGFVFNLISNKMFHMNAMFVPDSRREEVTWLGSMGIIVQNSQYKISNATYLRFETKGKKIYIGDKVTLLAKNIEKLRFSNGKLTISEATPFEGFRYPSVLVDLQDVGLNFTIKFLNEHLDLFWHSTGKHTEDSHGIIGQFFQKGVEIDETRKILILPGKEPVPVMRRPVWSFMEREVADDQLCWTAMNPGYQGEGLIDGTYFDYLVNDVLSTDFKFKKRQ